MILLWNLYSKHQRVNCCSNPWESWDWRQDTSTAVKAVGRVFLICLLDHVFKQLLLKCSWFTMLQQGNRLWQDWDPWGYKAGDMLGHHWCGGGARHWELWAKGGPNGGFHSPIMPFIQPEIFIGNPLPGRHQFSTKDDVANDRKGTASGSLYSSGGRGHANTPYRLSMRSTVQH